MNNKLFSHKTTARLRRITTALCIGLACAGLAGGVAAQSPQPNSPGVPTVYSDPQFHAGGATTPDTLGLTFLNPLSTQLQGTATGIVNAAGVPYAVEIPSFLLGNYDPTLPPSGVQSANVGTYFPNHFRDGTVFSWSAPFTFYQTPPNGVTATQVSDVQSAPVAVNVTEYPEIAAATYIGTQVGTADTPDTTLARGGGLTTGDHAIRQLVYFGRSEYIVDTRVGSVSAGKVIHVGAIYCADGFTGSIVWRYQTPTFVDATGVPLTDANGNAQDGSVFSTPAVVRIHVLTDPTGPTYANKLVVIVGDNNGFVYCLDAVGNGDGTSNRDVIDTATNKQPFYNAAAAPRVGTTKPYWVWRPDAAAPLTAAGVAAPPDVTANMPVPAAFGLASPTVSVAQGVTTPSVSNAIVYIGNSNGVLYALDALGVPNTSPNVGYNASRALPGVNGIAATVPTCNPRWWFLPVGQANVAGIEAAPSVSPPTPPFNSVTLVTADVNPTTGAVTFTATVSDATGNGGTPTGTVIFNGTGPSAFSSPAITLVNGVAAYTVPTSLTGGTYSVTAAYTPDAASSFTASTSPAFAEFVQQGVAGDSITVITSSTDPSTPGAPVTFTATVSDDSSPAGATPTGTITFSVDGTAIAGGPVTLAGGIAAFTAATLAAGTHAITAAYSGDATHPTAQNSTASFGQIVLSPIGPRVYFGTTHEAGAGSNMGRLYAVDGIAGPSGKSGTGVAPGTPGYNTDQRPVWAFPNAYKSGTGAVAGATTVRPALGDISGSPVVFSNADDVVTTPTSHPRTRIYIAADGGLEVPFTATGAQDPDPRPATDATGRIWAVEAETNAAAATVAGTVAKSANGSLWVYPEANDPNDATKDRTPEPAPPIGAFLHAAPAMGVVQFPATIVQGDGTTYTHADAVNADVKGKPVPMLYVGTRGTDDVGLYALDLDGNSDTTREIYRIESPTGATFESSPALTVNPSTTGGNGGAVFATAGNNLFQFTATPITDLNSGQAFPFVGADQIFGGFGPVSAPAVAAADTTDLATAAGLTLPAFDGGKDITDWVYVGDGTTGFCRGITPQDPNDQAIIPPTDFGGTVDVQGPRFPDQRYSLRTFLFDNTATHDATSADMTKANPIGGKLPAFEWGEYVYIRIGNVVPPGFDPSAALPNTSLLVQDPNDATGTTFYGNGTTVTFRVGDVSDPFAFAPTLTIAPVALTSLTAMPGENGLIQRTGADVTSAVAGAGEVLQGSLKDTATAAGHGWVAAYSYPVGSMTTRTGDTPGARREILEAHQSATRYRYTPPASGIGPGTYVADGTLDLIAKKGIGTQITQNDPATGQPTGIVQLPPVTQPTYGILNPLAVSGSGRPLSFGSGATTLGDGSVGPFGVISTGATFSASDLEALSNGNRIFTTQPPPSGTPVDQNPTTPSTTNAGNQNNYPKKYKFIATALGQIHDGSLGDNADSAAPGGYLLGAADRSALGTQSDKTQFPPFALSMKAVAAHWNDNTPGTSTATGGPGAVVNRLPWEQVPTSISFNNSRDYPDIPAGAITHTLLFSTGTADLSSRPAGALPDQTTGTPAANRTINPDAIKVAIQVPLHQPANLQAWDNTQYVGGGIPNITPGQLNGGDANFAEGYIEGSSAPQVGGGGQPLKLFVDINRSGFQTNNAPYRELSVFSGVSVNMSTSIVEQTRDIGNVPNGLGVQTGAFAALGDFTAYNPNFRSFFLPLTVHNDGNVNLLNVHLDQKVSLDNLTTQQSLLLRSDALDPLSTVPAFDITGINGTAGAYDVRSSLDSDLLVFARNPGIAAGGVDPYAGASVANLFPGATFHKPRVSDGGSSTLTVPDVPNDNIPGSTYFLPTSETPQASASGAVAAAPPFLSAAIPFGAPVGSYYQTIRLFESMDMTGYPSAGGAYDPLFPPQYGGAVGGQGTPAYALGDARFDTFLPDLPTVQLGQPATDPGTTLKAKVIEDRLTDGFPAGSLPHIDPIPAGPLNAASQPTSTPDFAPAAFRDPSSGNLSLFWTSGRGASGYGIQGANVTHSAGLPAFVSTGQQWWSPVNVSALTTPGTNSGLTVAQDVADPTHVYAFAVNVNATPYQNTLLSYTVNPGSGALSAPLPITNDPSQVKYGVRGLYTSTGFSSPTPSLWAFWTATTRGRTSVYYNSFANGAWIPATGAATEGLLPVPAGLTAVADPSPVFMNAPVIAPGGGFPTTGTLSQPVIEVTYSGTGPDGNTDLYLSRYAPDRAAVSQLNLVSFPTVTEILTPANGWYQARDVAWSRTGALNLSVGGVSILYDSANKPLFSRAVFDKASGLLVLTGVTFTGAAGGPITVYLDGATGRVRFAGGAPPVAALVTATFNPMARRITTDARADTAPVTFLDPAYKSNDTAGNARVPADRRWYLWRKSSAAGDAHSATLYQKTQRLTLFAPTPITSGLTYAVGNGAATTLVDVDAAGGRLFFPITDDNTAAGKLLEGQTVTGTYAYVPPSTITSTNPSGTPQTENISGTIQWQDEQRSNDGSVPPADTTAGLASLHEYALPIDNIVNEGNVSAFLDTDAYNSPSGTPTAASPDYPHKVWLFWNSTRNGTADLYYETINPRFAAGP